MEIFNDTNNKWITLRRIIHVPSIYMKPNFNEKDEFPNLNAFKSNACSSGFFLYTEWF